MEPLFLSLHKNDKHTIKIHKEHERGRERETERKGQTTKEMK